MAEPGAAGSFLDYPYAVSGRGTPRLTGPEDHLRDLIMQVLLTNPGERVNLPEFGVGVHRLVFAPNIDALKTSTRFLIMSALQRWLGDRITVEDVSVTGPGDGGEAAIMELAYAVGGGEAVVINIAYSVKATSERRRFQFRVGA